MLEEILRWQNGSAAARRKVRLFDRDSVELACAPGPIVDAGILGAPGGRVHQQLVRPRPLEPGDTVGIFTPSFPAHVVFREKYVHGVAQLEALGFRVLEGPLTARASSEGYRSDSPRERAA
jgi:hypothetical protein